SPLPDERQAAAVAVFSVCRVQDAALLGEAFDALLPERRALLSAAHALRAAAITDRRRLLPVARLVLTALSRDPLTAALRAELATAVLPWRELTDVFERMAGAGELHADALSACVVGLGCWVGRTDNADLVELEGELSGKSDERLRRLALAALTAQASLSEGWSAARLDRLRGYRADPSPLVAAAAQFTLPAEEEERPEGGVE